MSGFVPDNRVLRDALIFCFHLKKSATEAHQMLQEAYGEHALGRSQCFESFIKFENGDFEVQNDAVHFLGPEGRALLGGAETG